MQLPLSYVVCSCPCLSVLLKTRTALQATFLRIFATSERICLKILSAGTGQFRERRCSLQGKGNFSSWFKDGVAGQEKLRGEE